MKLQSLLYLAFAALGLGIAAYLAPFVSLTFERFGLSGTTFVYVVMQVFLVSVSTLFALLFLLFSRRGVLAISTAGGATTFELVSGREENAPSPSTYRELHRLGNQLNDPLSIPAFVVFRADKRYWVAPAPVFDSARKPPLRNEA